MSSSDYVRTQHRRAPPSPRTQRSQLCVSKAAVSQIVCWGLQVEIIQADDALYAAVVDARVAVKLGPGSWSPSAGNVPLADGRTDWALVTCGNEFAVRIVGALTGDMFGPTGSR